MDFFRGIVSAILILAIVLACVYAVYVFLDAWASTGPGCPGDPTWLGKCSEVEG